MTVTRSLAPLTIELVLRSVEIESGRNPSLTIGTATRQVKLAAPWPTSKITPRLRPSNRAGIGVPRRGPAHPAGRNRHVCRCLRDGVSWRGVRRAISPG